MIITQKLSAIADAAAQRYGLLTDAWRNIFTRSLDEADFGTQKHFNRTVQNAYFVANSFLTTEVEEIQAQFADIADDAVTTTRAELSVDDAQELPDDVREHVSAFEQHMLDTLSTQTERDIAYLKKSLQEIYLAVRLGARSQNVPLMTALIQYRIGMQIDLRFAFLDRRAARWPVRRYVRTVWRHNLLSLYNDTVLMTLAEHGQSSAQVRHVDVNSEWHGAEVSMLASTALPTYAEVREDVFHPNADAVLGRVM